MIYPRYFYFNGISSESYNLIACSVGNDNENELNMGLDYDAEYYETNNQRYDYGAKYKDVLTFDMTVCHADHSYFDRNEIREIMRWLDDCKDEMRWLTCYDEESDRNMSYLCRITSKAKIKAVNNIVALKFEVTCDSSYAYSDVIEQSTISTFNSPAILTIYIDSDDTIYPTLLTKYTGNDTGIGSKNMYITNQSIYVDNSAYPLAFEINNYDKFVSDETLQIDNLNHIIDSSAGHIFGKSFNGEFLKLKPGKNKIVVEFDGTVTFQYRCKYKIGEF